MSSATNHQNRLTTDDIDRNPLRLFLTFQGNVTLKFVTCVTDSTPSAYVGNRVTSSLSKPMAATIQNETVRRFLQLQKVSEIGNVVSPLFIVVNREQMDLCGDFVFCVCHIVITVYTCF
jgi:hypothetical protein